MDLGNIIFYLHLGALGLAAAGVLYADKLGFSWLLGKREVLSKKQLLTTHYMVAAALVLLVASGSYMFWPMREYLLHQPLFLLKMSFVLALVVNSFVIGSIMNVTLVRSFASLTLREKIPFFVSGAVSTGAWFGAGIVALLLFYF